MTARSIAAPEVEDGRSVLEILNVLLKRWRVVVGFPLVVAVVVVAISFLVPPTFTATTSFVPEMRSEGGLPGGLGALAGQLGISLGGEASQSPRFYAEVSKSRGVLDRLLLSRYADPRTGRQSADSATLLTILQSGGRNGVDSLERGARKLAGLIAVGVDAQTNIVTLKVQSQYPALAAELANKLVAYLNDFNTLSRQSQARERRKFTEQRVAAGEHELRDAEEALKRFYQANRSWQAVVPQRKSGPTRRLWALAAFVLSGVFAVSWAFSAEALGRARNEQDGRYRDLVTTARDVWNAVWPFGTKPKQAQRDS